MDNNGYIKIDGRVYYVPIVGLTRKFDFLEKSAERTEDGILHVQRIGTFENWDFKMADIFDVFEYAALISKLSEPNVFHAVDVPDGDGMHSATLYFAGITDNLRRNSGTDHFWKDLSFSGISQAPRWTP